MRALASHFNRPSAAEALAVSPLGLARYEVLQNEYHLLARDGFEGGLERLCLAQEIGMLPYYGLPSGYLTGKYRSEADYGRSVRGDRMAKYVEGRGPVVLAALDEIAAETGPTQAQIALAWIAARPAIVAPIASARTAEQLEDLLGAMELELSASQLAKLDAASTPKSD